MKNSIEFNKVTKRLPKHLHKFIVKQPYTFYTAQNQAVWRYVMRLNVDYLSKVAHKSYLEGLNKTGISVDAIPKMEGMNRILKDIGWAAVSVDGFIPPNAFMEFQAYNVLVIASDIRTIDHIKYTPAPDIIHEAAGHAPIIANPEYAEYLRRFGEIGCKAISSSKDFEMYEAIRLLSILKEDPNATEVEIENAQQTVEDLQNNMGELSEMAQIRNLHWWTVEYGLIGTLENPKIYGAGLLSSIGESKLCLTDKVKKVPYSIEAAQQNFDITQTQPQLFVTPDFAYLSFVLEEFANKMALRKGGLTGVQKLIDSNNLGTIELSTGIQISGVFTNVIDNGTNKPIYIQTTGPTALASRDKELIGHGRTSHPDGFGSPIGKLKGINLAIENMFPKDLEVYGIYEGKKTTLLFEGNIKVEGEVITGKRDLKGKILLISFKNCTVTHNDTVLFRPAWGIYDMAIGKEIVSAYAGPADAQSFQDMGQVSDTKTHKITYSEKEIELHKMYAEIAEMRSKKIETKRLHLILEILKEKYPNEWLLPLEMYEIVHNLKTDLSGEIYKYLMQLKHNEEYANLLDSGLKLILKNN
ncbi:MULTISPECIES: aromatic amino acid hydroxylase [Flavobacteriaceae]|uniref:Aromatic amino acid hydroxylase n=2 Tax=Flavobacteriaceae TaxID=49546 RepID=A0A4Y8APX3_9FLAO|nr:MULTISPECIES: aromatic amino acid hydroxylase [Flavobacteriaceae]TEW72618.1 aromatic amino acid hydroxylase [Gramella jeungdoensis]GGK54253.1 phenylalanine 4-monooxygenase [Lutibacter litoralis]